MTPFIDPALLVTVGGLLVGGLFVFGGLYHLFVVPTITQQLRNRGVPFPMATLIVGSNFEMLAGIAIIIRWHAPIAAIALILFTVASSCMMMNFWALTGEKRMAAIDAWNSNLGVIGGLLLVAALSQVNARRDVDHARSIPTLALMGGMAFLAGATDVYGFVELHGLYVSFMSGNTTMLGMSLGDRDFARSTGIAMLIGLFVLGAAGGQALFNLSGEFRTAVVALAVSALLCIPLVQPELASLAFVPATGALNAAVTQVSGASVSLTYVTGALIKFGQGMGNWMTGERADLSWMLHAPLWASFLAGSSTAAICQQFGVLRPWPLPVAGSLLALAAFATAASRSR